MFLAGESILIRTVLWDRVRYAQPAIVVLDDRDDVLMWFRPAGTPMKVPAAHLATGEDRIRLSREECQTGQWVHHDALWEATHVLGFTPPGSWWSVWQMWDAVTWEPLCWYVNFERPFARTWLGFDTRDLCLDLVVFPDGEIIEKDREDYDARVRTRLISPAEARSVEEALIAARRAAEAQSPPFDSQWVDWRPNPSWPVPSLRPDWWVT